MRTGTHKISLLKKHKFFEDRDPQDLTAKEAQELVRRMRERGASEVKLEYQPKQERPIKRQRSFDPRDEDEEDDVTVVSVSPATRGKRTKLGQPPGMEILDLTGDLSAPHLLGCT